MLLSNDLLVASNKKVELFVFGYAGSGASFTPWYLYSINGEPPISGEYALLNQGNIGLTRLNSIGGTLGQAGSTIGFSTPTGGHIAAFVDTVTIQGTRFCRYIKDGASWFVAPRAVVGDLVICNSFVGVNATIHSVSASTITVYTSGGANYIPRITPYKIEYVYRG